MTNSNIPNYLKSTISMIEKAFPCGMDENQYFALLYSLYEYMSDENLSIAVSIITGKNVATITNDIYKVVQTSGFGINLAETQMRLRESGFAKWVEEIE